VTKARRDQAGGLRVFAGIGDIVTARRRNRLNMQGQGMTPCPRIAGNPKKRQ
jgi:hypothetical protein